VSSRFKQQSFQGVLLGLQSGTIFSYSSKGTSQGYLQLRTKGLGGTRGQSACPVPVTGKLFNSRAFYATKHFLSYVFGVIEK